MATVREEVRRELLVDVEPNNITKGVSGTAFPMVFRGDAAFKKGDVITYNRWKGVKLFVLDGPFLFKADGPQEEGRRYTVQLFNNDPTKFLPNTFLRRGTIFFSI
jgi:hypothetical protein